LCVIDQILSYTSRRVFRIISFDVR
jgi:hypothetical protein